MTKLYFIIATKIFAFGLTAVAGLLLWFIYRDNIISGMKKKQTSAFVLLLLIIILLLFPALLIFNQIKILAILNASYQSQITHSSSVSLFHQSDSCLTGKATGTSYINKYAIPGVVGDGKTDNTAFIQTAIDETAKAGGGFVILPAGTFLINGHIQMKDNVGIIGAGPSTVLKAGPDFLQSTPKTGYSIITTNGASNVTIAHLTADQQGNILDGNSIDRFFGYVIHVFHSKNVIVDGVYIRNPFAYAIVAEDSSIFCFKNNNTQVNTSGKYDQLDGIHVLNSSYGDVLNNYVDQGYGTDGDDGLVAHTIGGSVHDVTYVGNIVRGGKGGSGMQLALTNATDTIYNIKIQNNEFWGSPRGIRTGYYGGPGGSVHNIVIGGSEQTGNFIHDNTFQDTKTGDAINIYGNGIDPYNITVSFNKACKAGSFSIAKGKDNITSYNSTCEQ